jgi:hypothetical protein
MMLGGSSATCINSALDPTSGGVDSLPVPTVLRDYHILWHEHIFTLFHVSPEAWLSYLRRDQACVKKVLRIGTRNKELTEASGLEQTLEDFSIGVVRLLHGCVDIALDHAESSRIETTLDSMLGSHTA